VRHTCFEALGLLQSLFFGEAQDDGQECQNEHNAKETKLDKE
jgi:hypothetical protein